MERMEQKIWPALPDCAGVPAGSGSRLFLRHWVSSCFVWGMGICLGGLGVRSFAEEARIWTSVQGSTMEASFLDVENGRVRLETPEGRVQTVGFSQLSEADQKWIKAAYARRRGSGKMIEPATPDKLPVFGDGQYVGRHAVVERSAYDAEVNPGGKVLIYPKHQGRRLEPAILLEEGCITFPGGKTPLARRRLVAFRDPPRPSLNPEELILKAELEEGVQVTLIITFLESSVRIRGKLVDPEGIADPTVLRLLARLPEVPGTKEILDWEEKKARVKGSKVELEPVKGPSITIGYADSFTHNQLALREVKVDAGMYGDRRIALSTGDHREANLNGFAYGGQSPLNGLMVIFTPVDAEEPGEKAYLEVRIE